MVVELKERKVPVSDLEIGMFVTRLDRDWSETNFMLQGFLIESNDDLQALKEQCQYVFIETRHQFEKVAEKNKKADERRVEKKGLFARKLRLFRGKDKPPAKISPPLTKPQPKKITYINKVTVEQEFGKAKGNYGFAKDMCNNILDGIRIGRTLDIQESKQAVSSIADSIIRNPNAMMWLSKLKNKDDYTAEHSLNVCILSIAFARHLGMGEEEIKKVGLCGLLHDVGKAKVPIEILNKPGRFTDEEYHIMNQHPFFGRNLLMSISNSDPATVDVAWAHHERVDGKGYPRKLEAHQIPYYAKIVCITDAYDAITSSRVYDAGRSSMEALDIVYRNKGVQFDEELALEFIKCIGIYPPGSIIEMGNGEVAIIIAAHKKHKLRPRVIFVLDEDKNKCKERIIDLLDRPVDKNGNPYEIICELPNGKYGVDLKEYMKKGLVITT